MPIFQGKDSFTLIELLIVTTLLAILGTVVIVVLNPAEMMKQSRDSQRLVDLNQLNKVLSFIQVDQPALDFGSSSVVYVSIPDTSPTCANLGLSTLPSGWSYSCVTNSADLQKTNGTGWIPVNFTLFSAGLPLSKLPVDPQNTTSTGQYYTYVTGGSWHLRTVLESSKYQSKARDDGGTSDNGYEIGSNLILAPTVFPHNWVKVPGNSTYNTSNFWVMKYEAKYDKTVDGKGDDASTALCAADSGDGLDWRDSGCSDATKLTATAEGSPVVHITHTQAVSACTSIGAHLLTNDEWMTIARNAEQVAGNWSGGSVGSGCLFRGNVGSDDSCGYNGSDPEKGTQRNAKAKLILSNGAEIWDIAGNIWEHVRRDASDTLTSQVNQPDTALGGAAFAPREFTALTGYGNLTYDMIRPSNASWNSSYGMGLIYTCDTCTDPTNQHIFLRGGRWSNGSNAGAFALNLNWGTGSQNIRCWLPLCPVAIA